MKHDPQEGKQHEPVHDPESSLVQQIPAQAARLEAEIPPNKDSPSPRFAGASKVSGSSRRREAIVRVRRPEEYLTRVDSGLGLTQGSGQRMAFTE